MAEIAGATVDFTDYSAPGTPRVLNIPDAYGDVTVQDIWDTLSAEAAKLDNLIYKKLLERPGFGGKGTLSPTKKIGISCKLNNVTVKFEDLPGPSYTIKRVRDGNLVAQDHLGADMEPMANSTFVNWKTEADVSAAIVETGVSGLLPGEKASLGKVDEFHQAYGLDAANPVTHKNLPATIEFAGITLTLTTDVDGNVIVQRL